MRNSTGIQWASFFPITTVPERSCCRAQTDALFTFHYSVQSIFTLLLQFEMTYSYERGISPDWFRRISTNKKMANGSNCCHVFLPTRGHIRQIKSRSESESVRHCLLNAMTMQSAGSWSETLVQDAVKSNDWSKTTKKESNVTLRWGLGLSVFRDGEWRFFCFIINKRSLTMYEYEWFDVFGSTAM